ncbi:heterokaryon incompatibility protein-domain-containing protein [Plectosphaerella cucumerina]|uniref:Heterokaryon incompatibility protein-domain-containing protein n=1 Tax=Plectosphaerella cucumerina TaxID=40658 RepID=A0A8K0T851_9PEZI|nr:heterokaryon incompatibility protein-domain-containing protein [Plectosphaerella cucumerina]
MTFLDMSSLQLAQGIQEAQRKKRAEMIRVLKLRAEQDAAPLSWVPYTYQSYESHEAMIAEVAYAHQECEVAYAREEWYGDLQTRALCCISCILCTFFFSPLADEIYDFYFRQRIVYAALPGPSYVRFILLQPHIGDALPSFTLEIADMNNSHLHYEAVSYRWPNGSWGSLESMAPVLFMGRKVHINSRLSLYLSRLQLRDRSRILWIDGLCINQRDPDERQQQVSMMQTIYARALRVLMVLDDDDIWFRHQPEQCFKTVEAVAAAWFSSQRSTLTPADNPPHSTSIFEGIIDQWSVECLRHIFSNRFWSRLWIVQEVVSSRAAVVLWRDASISWTLVGLVATLIRNNEFLWRQYTSPPRTKQRRRFSAVVGLMNAFLMNRMPASDFRGSSLAFLDLLRLTRNFNVTEPLDRIYAILGLPSQHTGPGRTFITPNYRIPKESLYLLVFQRVVATHGTPLTILSAVRHLVPPSPRPNVATWIPQWHVKPIRGISGTHHDGGSFKASAGYPSSPMFRADWTLDNLCLTLEGFVIGYITSSQTVLPPRPNPKPHEHGDEMTLWIDCHGWNGYQDRLQLGLTLTAGQDWYGNLVQGVAAHEKHERCFVQWARRNHWNPCLLEDAPAAESDENVAQYGQAVRNVCEGRKLFAASPCGVGIGPEVMQPGDLVCVLLGGPVPYVLRPLDSGEHYFVGECYVHEHMFGKAIQEMGSPQTFVLR